MNGYKVPSQDSEEPRWSPILLQRPTTVYTDVLQFLPADLQSPRMFTIGGGLYIRKCVVRGDTYEIFRRPRYSYCCPLLWQYCVYTAAQKHLYIAIPSPSHPWAEPLVLPIVLLEFEHTCAKMCASVTLIIRPLQPATQCPYHGQTC